MIRKILLATVAAGALASGNGCRHSCCKPNTTPSPFLPPPPGGASMIPPAGVPTAPNAVPVFPPPPVSGSIPPPDPLLGGPGSNYTPPAYTPPPAVKPAPEILLPDPLPSSGTSRGQAPSESRRILGDPTGPRQSPEPPLSPRSRSATPENGFPPPADPSRTAAKPPAEASRYPGLTGFIVVKDGVATGRTPTPVGLDLLKKSGYRTVVYLHDADADLTTLRAEVERRGLVFTPIETTPARLTSAVDAFNRVIITPQSRPVYICDDEGLRAGVLWYVHFRNVEILNADAARVRARPLGYTEDGEAARTFQIAVQRYFETR